MAYQIYLTWLVRESVDETAWNQRVSEAHNALVYGNTWYLDAVTNVPDWRWEGLVLPHDSGVGYAAVMPVPLRKRWGRWVIYQPLFCQFLAIFSQKSIDPTPFLEALGKRYRYASSLHLLMPEPLPALPGWVQTRTLFTHVLLLTNAQSVPPHQSIPHTQLVARYTPDRQMNLRRAINRTNDVVDWQLVNSENVEPLLALFRENHADTIGVGEWAYDLFRGVVAVLRAHGLGTLRYACVAGKPVAGAFFVEANGRIIYLFNAADAEGRRLNARTILLDEAILNGTKKATDRPLLFDFESPDKPGVVSFYESFGAVPQAYTALTWSRLTWLERIVRYCIKRTVRRNGEPSV
jgi:Acetyltransferase (GNAT) domain